MPSPFTNALPASSQQIHGDQILFPSEEPRLNSMTPVVQQPPPNINDEAFRSALSSTDAVDTGLGLQGLHVPPGLDMTKSGAENEGSLAYHPYPNPLDSHIAYGVPGLDYNAAVLPQSYEPPVSSDISSNILNFYPNPDAGPKPEPQVASTYNSESHIPSHPMLATSALASGQSNIKEEQVTSLPSRRGSHANIALNPSKAATISGFNLRTAPPPINTDTLSSGTKSQHGTWRRGNKGRTPLSVKRSQSTPNVQLAAQLAAASAVSAPPIPSASTTDDISPVTLAYQLDKKRNKLGYHRTSVACGHCRRRKIRCILAKDESGRCSNCIRLKKECSFYPVESADRRPRSASKPEISQIFQDNCSSPSSPTRSPRLSVDQINMNPAYDGSLYPSSLPITPNYECETPGSTLDDVYRNRSLSSSSRVSLAFSNSGSRRPSIAHTFTAPLPSREFRSLSDASPTYGDTFSTFASRFNNAKAVGIGIEDPPSSFWRLENASNNFSPLSQHVNFGGMPLLQEDTIRHERLNSVDNGVGPMAQTYADAGLFSIGSDPPADGALNNGKPLLDVQNGPPPSFLGEGTDSFPVNGGYDLSWNASQRNPAAVAHSSGLADNWFLPQHTAPDMLCETESPVQRLNQAAVGVEHD
ncbi:hypothetical protein TWF696_004499 [Orbilia brochopaga]|uniref:Zn(2)-C6 fungal-type domain-containing protein n=1 Tax=Orbilia brochopaga TaxID=3140254 RepID=A0AAV9V701_9PEZI